MKFKVYDWVRCVKKWYSGSDYLYGIVFNVYIDQGKEIIQFKSEDGKKFQDYSEFYELDPKYIRNKKLDILGI